MALEQQLQRWKNAGLISPEQVDSIRAFEKRRDRPRLVYAVASLAGLAVAIGLVSIVASNWDLIPGRLKLVLDAVVLIAVGQAVVQLRTRPPTWLGDAATIIFYGLTLASIALIGQVYQLGGNTALALGLWSALTFGVFCLGSSARLGTLWLIGLMVTYFVGLSAFAESGSGRTEHALAAVYWAPLAALELGRSAWLRRVRPSYARVFRALGWTELVALAALTSFAFYDARAPGERIPWLVIGVSLVATGWMCFRIQPTPVGRAERLLLAVTFAASHLPMFMPHGKWALAAALSFIGVFAVLAFVLHRKGRSSLLHVATAAIGVRLLVVYFEVFGTLLDTGLGLVLGGLLTLVITWLWVRKRKDFDQKLRAREIAP
jgi:uncharacterized membrane protein